MVYKKNSRRTDKQQPIDPNYAHLQPQAPEIERAVLGALLIDKDAFETVCKWLTPETFYLPNHQKIYSAIRDLARAEKPVDVLTVTEKLAKMGLLEDIGGPATIGEISGRVATSANIDYNTTARTPCPP